MSKSAAKSGSNDPSRLANLVRYVFESMVAEPEAVSVTESTTDAGRVILVRVSEGDVGRVIGRQGRTIRAIRTVLGLARRTLGESASVEIVEN
jgi:hypothetical protein